MLRPGSNRRRDYGLSLADMAGQEIRREQRIKDLLEAGLSSTEAEEVVAAEEADKRARATTALERARAAKPIASTLPNLPQGGPSSKILRLALAVCDTSRSHTQLANDLAALFPDRCRVDRNGRLWLDGTDRHGVLVRAMTAARKR